MKEFVIESLELIDEAAFEIVSILKKQYTETNCVAFYGQMGAGKTTLIKAICKVLGVNNIVNSPTFAIINEYLTNDDVCLYHFDLYRINKLEEAYDIGADEYLYSNNYCFIEWPEIIESILPKNCLYLKIEEIENNKRIVRILENEKN